MASRAALARWSRQVMRLVAGFMSRIARPAGKVSCAVDVLDADDDAIDSIDLFVDGKVAQTARPGVPRYSWSTPVTLAPGPHYLFVRVTHTDGRQTWSSPVWVNAY